MLLDAIRPFQLYFFEFLEYKEIVAFGATCKELKAPADKLLRIARHFNTDIFKHQKHVMDSNCNCYENYGIGRNVDMRSLAREYVCSSIKKALHELEFKAQYQILGYYIYMFEYYTVGGWCRTEVTEIRKHPRYYILLEILIRNNYLCRGSFGRFLLPLLEAKHIIPIIKTILERGGSNTFRFDVDSYNCLQPYSNGRIPCWFVCDAITPYVTLAVYDFLYYKIFVSVLIKHGYSVFPKIMGRSVLNYFGSRQGGIGFAELLHEYDKALVGMPEVTTEDLYFEPIKECVHWTDSLRRRFEAFNPIFIKCRPANEN